jgi:hypothetical protein
MGDSSALRQVSFHHIVNALPGCFDGATEGPTVLAADLADELGVIMVSSTLMINCGDERFLVGNRVDFAMNLIPDLTFFRSR